MKYVADLHLHSKYSRAVSPQMILPVMAETAVKKGINVLTTGDFTHPLWLREIKDKLIEEEEGLYGLKDGNFNLRFLLSVEVASIYSEKGKGRRIHSLIFAPDLEIAEKINKELLKRGTNLSADGRPMFSLTPSNIIEIIKEIDDKCFLIPCHVWTPWYSLYGSMSGFDSIDECFGKYSDEIFGIETGLSSDPLMNWRIKELENRSILSFSDSHSPVKMGRESTVFDLENLSYESIKEAIEFQKNKKGKNKIAGTIEFYPEEGKYHYSGHRDCGVIQSAVQTKSDGDICPVCKKRLTIGVEQRVEDLAFGAVTGLIKKDLNGVCWVWDPNEIHPPFVNLVSLNQIIAEIIGMTPVSMKVADFYEKLVSEFGNEINVLMKANLQDIGKIAGDRIALGVGKVRSRNLSIRPGFDGVYGEVKIVVEDVISEAENKTLETQIGIDF